MTVARNATGTRSMPLLLVDDARFDGHEDESGDHPECPERLAAARAGLFSVVAPEQRVLLAAREASDAELARVHAPTYVEQLKAALRAHRGHLDPDTYFCKATREAAWLAAGGGIDLAQALVRGDGTRGFALLRPPGHHAVPSGSMGFCLLNNVALAASAALAAGLSRVAIVDWDVHHGNGTQDAFYDDPRVMFVSLHQYPFYPGTGAANEIGRGAGAGYTANLALPAGSSPEAYGAAFRTVILPVLRAYDPQLILVSAGFDAHARDPLAQMQLDAASYGAFAASLIELAEAQSSGRIGFVLEGGYDLLALSESVTAVAHAAMGTYTELPDGRLRSIEHDAIAATRRALAPYWPTLA